MSAKVFYIEGKHVATGSDYHWTVVAEDLQAAVKMIQKTRPGYQILSAIELDPKEAEDAPHA